MSATLVSIAVTTPLAIVPVNGTAQLVATGTYDDASTADVTSTATWSSADTRIATVGAATGLVTGVSSLGPDLSSVVMTATLSGVSGSVAIAVQRKKSSWASVDVSALAAYTATQLGYWASSLTLVNKAAYAVDVSFDGVNKCFELAATGGVTAMFTWRDGDVAPTSKVYLKRQGSGGGAAYVEVISSGR